MKQPWQVQAVKRFAIAGWLMGIGIAASAQGAEDPAAQAQSPLPYPATIAVDSSEKQEPAPPKDEAAPTQLEGVVVTSTKRARSVRELPATVNALTGEKLEGMGAQGVDDFLKLVPGVSLTYDGTNPKRISVRGVSADIGTNLTTGVLIGDVPFSDPYLPRVALDPNPFDLATVEVLKGPQGTLFGGSGLNGAIRYVPEPPKFGQAELKYFAQYTDYGREGAGAPVFGAMVNTPLANDVLALRLVGFWRKAPGYIDDLQSGADDVNELRQHGFRGILAWRPGENWDISLMHTLQDTHIADLGFADNPNGRLQRSNSPRPSPVDTHYDLTNLGITYHMRWADFVSQSSRTYKKYTAFVDVSRLANEGQQALLGSPVDNHSRGLIQEFRLVSPTDPGRSWNWLLGVFGYRVKQYDCLDLLVADQALPPQIAGLPLQLPLPRLVLSLPIPIPIVSAAVCPGNQEEAGNQINAAHFLDEVTATELAVFGESSLRLFGRLEVTLGGRLYRTRSGGTVTSAGAEYVVQNQGLQTVRNASVQSQGFNPKVALSYRISRNLLGYASASRGFRFGGIQASAGSATSSVPQTFQSDHLWNYEVGLRSQWFRNTLLADFTAFYVDWKNPQLIQIAADGINQYLTNVGGARSRGGEASLQYRVPFLPGLSLSAAAAYASTETTEPFTTSAGTSTRPGTEWPLSPKWQTSTTLAYQLLLGSWSVTPSLLHTYSSTAFNNLDHSARVYGYSTLDAQLRLSNLGWRWLPAATLSVSNLADRRGLSNVAVANLAGVAGYTDYTYIPPRSITLRLDGHF